MRSTSVGGRSVRQTANVRSFSDQLHSKRTQDASNHDGHWTCRKRCNLTFELRTSRISKRAHRPFLRKCSHALNANGCPLTTAKMPEVCNFCQVSSGRQESVKPATLGLVVDGRKWVMKLSQFGNRGSGRSQKRTFPATLCWCLQVMTLKLGVESLRRALSSGLVLPFVVDGRRTRAPTA